MPALPRRLISIRHDAHVLAWPQQVSDDRANRELRIIRQTPLYSRQHFVLQEPRRNQHAVVGERTLVSLSLELLRPRAFGA